MSAVDELRKTVVEAGDGAGVALRAVVELADQVDSLRRAVFPRPPEVAPDAAVVAAQPMAIDKPQLGGTFEEPAATPAPEPQPAVAPVFTPPQQAG